MSLLTLALAMVTALSASAWNTGTLATWEGEMAAERADQNVGPKSISLTVLAADTDANSATLLWTLIDKGRGGLPWTGSFGQWRLSDDGRTLRGAGPTVLFDHGEGEGEAALDLLFVQPPDELKEGVAWTQGQGRFTVAEGGAVEDRGAWRVEVRGPFGLKGELWLDRQTRLPVAVTQRLTLGQGKPHVIQLKLKKSETIAQESLSKAKAAFERWVALRDELKLPEGARENAWSDEQFALLKEQLPEAISAATDTPLAAVAAAAEEDLRLQIGRSGRVASLRSKLLDRPAPNFELQGMRSERLANKDLAGAVTVLHFWEYRDAPLEEPYGQVGYLDFLYRKHKDASVKVYGIAVDERLADAGARSQVVSSARKLHSFMNLSYPLLLDDGTVLNRFGDPRAAGGKLPLFVVLGADGRVLHYHAGFHEVDRDLGLKDLEQAVQKALK